MTVNFAELAGLQAERLIMPLSHEAKAALIADGISYPETGQIVLVLREASMRERAQYDADQKGAALKDPHSWLAGLLARRAEGNLDRAVLMELVKDLGPSEVAMITHAYLTGKLPDPKVTQQAIQQTLIGMSNGLLATLANVEPSRS